MDDLERSLIERACERLVIKYCHVVDHGQATKIADQFTEDGVWSSSESTLTGRSEMKRYFQAREDNKGRASRHICTNILIEVIDEQSATGVSYITVFRHDGPADRETSPTDVPAALGEYRDTFVRTEEGWRIKRRDVTANFVKVAEDKA